MGNFSLEGSTRKQSADTRLAGEDGDHARTMKLSEKELRRILEHGRHFPFLTPKEGAEGGNGHWRMRMWEPSAIEIWGTTRDLGFRETSAIEIWGTTRDLGFLVSKDKNLVRSTRDAAEDRQSNLVISPEILSFCRRKIEEWDQQEESDLCTRSVQELVCQWLPGRNAEDLAKTDQEDACEGQFLSRKLGGTEGPSGWQEMVGRGKRWEEGLYR
jgi:hypothetical protein